MAKKKTISETKKLVQELLAKETLIFGTGRTIKELKKGKLRKVFYAANCPETAKTQIIRYSRQSDLDKQELPLQSSQLGVLCKKTFSISVFGVKKE
jgi:ribosomal protein L30E